MLIYSLFIEYNMLNHYIYDYKYMIEKLKVKVLCLHCTHCTSVYSMQWYPLGVHSDDKCYIIVYGPLCTGPLCAIINTIIKLH